MAHSLGQGPSKAAKKIDEVSVKLLSQQQQQQQQQQGTNEESGRELFVTGSAVHRCFICRWVLLLLLAQDHAVDRDAGADMALAVQFANTQDGNEPQFDGTPLAFTTRCLCDKQSGGKTLAERAGGNPPLAVASGGRSCGVLVVAQQHLHHRRRHCWFYAREALLRRG